MESFKLTQQALNYLKVDGLNEDILKKLEPLIDEKFETEDEFLEAVEQEIGNDQPVRDKDLILKRARKIDPHIDSPLLETRWGKNL